MKAVPFAIVALLLSGAGMTGVGSAFGSQPAGGRNSPLLAARAEAARLTISVTTGSAGAVGVIALTARSGKMVQHRTVRAARRSLLLPLGSIISLTERPIRPALWEFRGWTVSPRGESSYTSTRSRLTLRLNGNAAVRADFEAVSTATPTVTVPATVATAAPPPPTLVAPSATPTTEPICRSWHPVPRCRFPTPTAAD